MHSLIEQYKADRVIGTETWLSSATYDTEIIPSELGYNVYRRDRGSRGGGVLIIVDDQY